MPDATEQRHMFEGLSDFANLPLLALVATVLSLALMPLLNAYSRFNERQADRYCFEAIASVLPVASDSSFATCTGADLCNACKNCRYCRHCAKATGTCGICKN